jgi:hypothetical protein
VSARDQFDHEEFTKTKRFYRNLLINSYLKKIFDKRKELVLES